MYRIQNLKTIWNPMMDFPGISTFVKTGIFREKMVILDNTFGSENTVELQLPLCLGKYSMKS